MRGMEFFMEFFCEHYANGEQVAIIVPVQDYRTYRVSLFKDVGATLESEETVTGLDRARHKAKTYVRNWV